MTAKEKKRNAAKKAAGTKKAYEEELRKQRTTFADYGCQNPSTRVVENKRAKANKNACRGSKFYFKKKEGKR